MEIKLHSERKGVALITGAAQGLGQSFARRLARDGFDIVAADLRSAEATAQLVAAEGRACLPATCDVTDETSVQALASAAMERFGRVDVLVNNAGVYPERLVADMSFAEWRRVMTLNLDAPFLLIKAVLPSMQAHQHGRIVNIASAEAWMMVPGNTHYIASKMGLVGLTRGLASEVGDVGITVNAVAPGLTRTPGTLGASQQQGLFEMLARMQAIRRAGEPADIAGVVSFLASDDARFVTGQTVVVDGGLVRL
jgi:NAD(P)-dependent dehydrogenase (short-subunit alcohol dehydrogenase family)